MDAPAPSLLSRAMSVPDFVLRLLYFLVVPFAVFILAHSFPLGAALINVGIALLFFFAAEWLKTRVPERGPLGRFVARQLALERYYREHPPRNFLYYVFFLFLFPYWLIKREARKEAGLFRRFALSSIVLLGALRAVDYWVAWQPIVPFKAFAIRAFATLVVQLYVAFALAMPLVVTVVGFHLQRKRKRLVALFVVAALSVGLGLALGKQLRFAVQAEAMARAGLKAKYAPERAHPVLEKAVRAASVVVTPPGPGVHVRLLEGAPLEVARNELLAFYRPDEAACFLLVEHRPVGPEGQDGPFLNLVAETRSKNPEPIYVTLHAGKVGFGLDAMPSAAKGKPPPKRK